MKFYFSKKKKFHYLEQRIKLLLNIGWILPFAILSSIPPAYASNITETQSSEGYFINYNYNHSSDYYFRDWDNSTSNMIISANDSTVKTWNYGGANRALIPVDGTKELTSLGNIPYDNLVDNAVDEKPNALMALLYNSQNNKYEYRALATCRDDGPMWSVNDYVTANVFGNPDYVLELYQLIHTNDKEGLNNFMSNYLPKYYLVKLPQEELDRANDIISSYDELIWFGDEGDFTKFINSHPDIVQEIDVVHRLMDWGESVQTGGSTKSYNSVDLKNGEEWRPMDRTVTLSSGEKAPYSDQNEYSINSCWFAKGGKISPGTGYDEDFSQWGDAFDGETVLIYDDTEVEGTSVPDYSQTAITVGQLSTEKGSVINMSWANTNQLNGDTGFNSTDNMVAVRTDNIVDAAGNEKTAKTKVSRIMFIDDAKLGDGTVFRLGGYNSKSVSRDLEGNLIEGPHHFYSSDFDSVYIKNAVPAETKDKSTSLYIQLGYVPGIEKGNSFGGVDLINDVGYDAPTYSDGNWNMHGYKPVLGILNGAENFTVSGQESKADGVFNVYTIKPEVDKVEDYFANDDGSRSGTLWYLTGYTFQNTGEVAESGKNASDNMLVTQNLWRGFSDHAFRRPADLHTRYAWRDEKKEAARENAWAEVWHGRFNSSGDYGRDVGQSYTGMMAGYDKMLNREYYGGNVYAGFYAARLDGSSHTPSQGHGDQEGSGLGIYGSWVGQKGHYIDAEASAIKLKNEYHFYGNNGKGLHQLIYTPTGTQNGGADTTGDGTYGNVEGKGNTWAYGLGLRYGKRTDKGSAWFDPHVSVYAGHIEDDKYTLSNDLIVNTKGWNSFVGKAGLTVGKNLAKNKGIIYAGVDVAHEFGGKQEAEQLIEAHASNGTTGTGRIKARQLAGEQGGSDTWAEVKVGGDVALSKATRLHVDYERTLGRKAGNDWNISGRLEVSWDGIGGKGKKGKTEEAKPLAGRVAANDVANTSQQGAQAVSAASDTAVQDAGTAEKPTALRNAESRTANVTNQALPAKPAANAPLVTEATASKPVATANTSENPVIWQGEGDLAGFMLSQITVEAPRPDWEQKLSPGQVTVIDPKEFEGEQKDIPALLERVPGLFVDRQNGQGHYTTARIRGSSAAQVDVYIDGVRANLSGDAAVNLSAIPADNVARIEVYRGYVPARFAGAPLGGVINIVTKKPDSGHGRITQGMRSYGGATTTMEYSTPLGKGSLLATATRDIWDGDFPVKAVDNDYSTKAWRRSNGFRDTDGMLKWQDDHWTVKAQYKHNHEELAPSLSFYNATDPYWRHGYLDSHLDLDYKEFYVGREDNWKDLNLNWHVAYTDSKKKYRHTGMMRNIEDAKNWPPSEDLNGWWPYGEEVTTSPGSQWADYHSKKWDFNVNLSYNLWNSHLLELNANVVKEKMDADGNDWTTERYWPWISTIKNKSMLNRYNNSEYHFTLQDTMLLNRAGDLKFTAIGRADKVKMDGLKGAYAENDGDWRYSGGVALQKQFNDHWGFKTTWGTYYRHPNFYEMFGDGYFVTQSYFQKLENSLGYKKGAWEWGHQFDFGVNYQGRMAGADTSTNVTWFQRHSNNQLVLYTPYRGSGESYYMPSGNVAVHGIEFSHNMKWDRLNFALAGTWQKGRSAMGIEGASLGARTEGASSFVPNWVIDSRIDYTFPGDKLSIFGEYQYHGREVIRGTESSATTATGKADAVKDSYSIFNLGAHYKFNKALRVSVGVNDVFNAGYKVMQDYYGTKRNLNYPMAGRTYYGTVEYTF